MSTPLELAWEIVEHYEAKGRAPVYTDMHLVARALIEADILLRQHAPKPHWSEVGASLINRLRGIYAVGPGADQKSDGVGEFGTRQFTGLPAIQFEAAQALMEAEKQREPVEVVRWPQKKGLADELQCGGCERPLATRFNFCPNCGHPLKWTREKV